MKCEIPGCNHELSEFHPDKPQENRVLIQVLNTGKLFAICENCAKKLGFK